ncbi:MAG TPA: GNAT family N-acetyltransferase [Thermodesulfovibrionales bacterium]|nr:GNAT family N-acetyltransferase [Thermodesulfovibrionales bacterium]
MNDGRVRLRPLRISDIPFMHKQLRDKDILKAIGLTRPFTGSWFHLWWRLRKTLIFRYAIEADSRLIGFIGLHRLMPGISAELTLLIADEKSRRLGHGARAFTLLAQNLEKYSSTRKLIVRVRPDNEAACSFWEKMGFEMRYDEYGMHVMSAELKFPD